MCSCVKKSRYTKYKDVRFNKGASEVVLMVKNTPASSGDREEVWIPGPGSSLG